MSVDSVFPYTLLPSTFVIVTVIGPLCCRSEARELQVPSHTPTNDWGSIWAAADPTRPSTIAPLSSNDFTMCVPLVGARLPVATKRGRRAPLAGDGQAFATVVVGIHPGLALGEARGAEGREIHQRGLALDDPLGETAADGGGGLEGGAGVAEHDPETRDRGDLV